MIGRDQALAVLKRNEDALKARGILHAGVFGSVARDEATADSDLDVIIEIDRLAKLTVFDYVAIKHAVAALFHDAVDVVEASALKRRVAASALRDAVYAF